jgi:uncharacterized membrane protein
VRRRADLPSLRTGHVGQRVIIARTAHIVNARGWSCPIVAATVTAAIGALRVRDEPYWLDESVTALIVRRPIHGLARVLYDQEAGMMPYFGSLWMWAHAFSTDAGLRMFSVIGGAVAVLLTVRLASRWFGMTAGLMSGLLMVTNPFFLRYLTEARTYSWLMAIGIGFLMAVERWFERDRNRDAMLVGLVAGLGLTTHVLFALLMVLVPIVKLSSGGRVRRSSALWAAVVAIFTTLPALPAVHARSGQLEWLVDQSWRVEMQQILDYAGGTTNAVVLGVGSLLAMLAAIRQPAISERVLLVVGPGVVMPLMVLLLSQAREMLLARYLAPAFPLLIIGAAAGLTTAARLLFTAITPQLVAVLASLAVGISFAENHPFDDRSRGVGTAEAVTFINQHLRDGDVVMVVHHPADVLHHLGYRPDIDPQALPLDENRLAIPRASLESKVGAFASAARILVIYWDGWPAELASDQAVEGRRLSEEHVFGSTTVFILS